MWLYFNQYGELITPALQHGPNARTGTTNFQIFAYFEGVDLAINNFATIKLIKPDFNDSSYPLLAMKYVPAMKYERMTGDNNPNFSTSGGPNGDGYYPGFLFDFSNFSGDQNVAILLDTPGLWRAVINLYGTNHVISTQGTATFNVEAGTLDTETEITIDELMSSYASAIQGKLDITSGIVSVDNINDSSFVLSKYSNGQMFYDKASNKLYKNVSGSLVEKFDFNITPSDVQAKADKVVNAVDDDLAMLDIEGNLKDSGIAKDNVALKTELNNKVDKESGKGLSTNDFTDSYKSQVEQNTTDRHTHSNKSILDDISVAFTTEKDNALSGKADKVSSATNNDLAALDSNGNLKDSGVATSKIGELDTRVDNLENVGRFLSLWNATTGEAQKNPPHTPYEYHDGDYFRVATGGNRIPNGTSYVIGGTNYVTSQITVGVGDVIYYDEGNEAWQIQTAGSGGQVVDVQINGTSIVGVDGSPGIANITKTKLGLGNVVNTGDSATPVSGGTTKFTTGGAYTELNKKLDKSSSYFEDNVIVFNSSGGAKDSSLGKDSISVNNVAVVQNATTNLNGVSPSITNLHTADFSSGNYTGLKLLKNTNDILTENDAKSYMYCMCGSRYVPKYVQNVCKNSFFVFANGKMYKPQYDTTNGLVLYYMNSAIIGNILPAPASSSVLTQAEFNAIHDGKIHIIESWGNRYNVTIYPHSAQDTQAGDYNFLISYVSSTGVYCLNTLFVSSNGLGYRFGNSLTLEQIASESYVNNEINLQKHYSHKITFTASGYTWTGYYLSKTSYALGTITAPKLLDIATKHNIIFSTPYPTALPISIIENFKFITSGGSSYYGTRSKVVLNDHSQDTVAISSLSPSSITDSLDLDTSIDS